MTDVRELIESESSYGMALSSTDGDNPADFVMRDAGASIGRLCAALTAALEREEALKEALAAKFAVTDAMEKAGVNHAIHESVSSASGGWPGYVRRLWGAMNMARISDSSPENTNGN